MDEKDFYIQSLNLRLAQERRMASQTIERLRALHQELEQARFEVQNRRFEAVIQRMGKGAIICGPDWKVMEINPAAERCLNNTGLAGSNILDFIFQGYTVKASRPELEEDNWSFKVFDIVRQETPDFGALYLELTIDRITADRPEDSRIIILFYDVTSLREEELLKSNFISLLSHKLLTPVTVISVTASTLKDGTLGELGEKQLKALDSISGKAGELKSLIEKLFGFSQILSGEINQPKETIDVCRHIPMLMNEASALGKVKKIDWEFDCPDKELKVGINQMYFYLIVRNLLENAVKFNDQDIVRIRISANRVQDRAEFIFSDNGRGIPPEEMEKVFQRFYQIEKDFTGNVPGLGLGLAIVKRLIEAHGGDIRLESEIGKGTTVIFSLPGYK